MDLRQLKYFAAVARLGSFTAASRELHVSQPALGYKIKQLEETLGTALLERHSRGVTPTPAGETLQRHAERIFAEIERAETAIRKQVGRPTSRIVLGVTPTTGKELLPAILEQVARRSAVELSLRQGMSHELQTEVASGRIDMAFCFDPEVSADLLAAELFRERLCLVGPPAIVKTRTPIAFDNLAGVPLILDSRYAVMRAQIEATATRRRIPLSVSFEVEPIELKRTLMVKSRVCTIVPFALFDAEIRAGDLVARRIVKPTLRRVLHVVWRRALDPGAARLIVDIARAEVDRRIHDGDLGWEAPRRKPDQ